jgi:uncharacterized protein (TIGR03083 family)
MIATTHLFPILDSKLIELLRSLTPDEWQKPTLAKQWTVKDIAAHLLDTNVRSLAARDNHFVRLEVNITSYSDLVNYLNQLNAEWVTAVRRISPRVLTDFLEDTGKQYSAYIASLDMNADAPYSVAWAGEERSTMWFHVAREYTEKWHHQQQIRQATEKEGIMARELFYPCIDTFLCGLPHTYRNTVAPEGTVINITIETAIGGDWYLLYNGTDWTITKTEYESPTATIIIPPEVAWKLFTKGITAAEAKQHVIFNGNEHLAKVVLDLVAVIA